MDDKFPPLPDDIASLLSEARGAPPPPDSAKMRVGQRLSASLGVSMLGAAAATELLAEGAAEVLSEAAVQGAGAISAAGVGTKAGAVAAVAAAKGAGASAAASTVAASTAAASTVAVTTTAAASTVVAATGAAGATAAASGAAGTAGLFALLAKPALIGTFVAGTMVGGTTIAVVEPEIITAEPIIVYVEKGDPRLPTALADEEAVDTKAEAPAPEAEAPPPAPVKKVRKASKKRVAATTAADSDRTLARERALIEMASTAISRGQPETALASLKTHETRYPRGRLVEEREGLRVLALVGQGKKKEAQRRADRFAKRYPKSLLNAAIDNALQR